MKSDKEARDVGGHCIDSFNFFSHTKTKTDTHFLAPFIVSGN